LLKKFGFPVAALVMLISGCASVATTDTGNIPVTRNFEAVSMGWERQDTETIFFYLVRNRGGMTEVCGAIATDGISTLRALEPRIKRQVYLSDNSTIVLNSIQHFNRINLEGGGQQARCAVTSVPWNPAWENNSLRPVRSYSHQLVLKPQRHALPAIAFRLTRA